MEAEPSECGQLRSSNVFILTSVARDKIFPTGRCILSAETLTEMRRWVEDIRRLLGSRSSFSSISDATKGSIIKKNHIMTRTQKNNPNGFSFDTLPRLETHSRPDPCLNSSFPAPTLGRPLHKSASPQSLLGHAGPKVLGLDEADTGHNLTYSYSSDEDEAAGGATCPRSPRSVDTSLRRRVLDQNKHLAYIDSSEEDIAQLNDLVENEARATKTQSYNSLVKIMETGKQQSENLRDIFKQHYRDVRDPPPELQEKVEAVTQIVQRLETQATAVIQVRLGNWVTQTYLQITSTHCDIPSILTSQLCSFDAREGGRRCFCFKS